MCGADSTSAPVPPLEFVHRLFRHLVQEQRLLAAMSVARQYAVRAVQSKATLLLRELLEHAVPLVAGENGASQMDCNDRLILRADIMTELANWLKKADAKS